MTTRDASLSQPFVKPSFFFLFRRQLFRNFGPPPVLKVSQGGEEGDCLSKGSPKRVEVWEKLSAHGPQRLEIDDKVKQYVREEVETDALHMLDLPWKIFLPDLDALQIAALVS